MNTVNVLDFDLRDDAQAYGAWIDHAAEFEEEIARWHVRAYGFPPSIYDMHHAVWRITAERDRWITLRRALENTWPIRETPEPVEPEPVTPGPIEPGSPLLVARGPFHPRFYSYWSNAVVLNGETYVFAGGLDDTPQFFKINRSNQITELGPLVRYRGTTEGWYWDANGWLYIADGPRLLRVNPFTHEEQVAFDVSQGFPDSRIWQTHSSDDGRTHSATLQRTTDWQLLGTVAWRYDRLIYIPARGKLDESAITSDGRYLIIKEDNDNLIVDLDTREERRLTQDEGAVGHSDSGPHYVIGEDDAHGACVYWDLRKPLSQENRRELFRTWNMGHVSVRKGRCLVSNATEKEIALIDVSTGEYFQLVRNIHGWGGDYDSQVRANLSPCGTRACWMAGGSVYVMHV